MISIVKANASHVQTILTIGKISVEEAHRSSCDATVLGQYIEKNYNTKSIQEELKDDKNIYHILYVDDKPAGFSKIILNVDHPNNLPKNSTKLDRIYLLSDFFDRKLGLELLQFNINLAKNNNQSGMWLFTWVGNTRAINFYLKHGFQIIGSHNFQVTETHFNLNHQMFLRF